MLAWSSAISFGLPSWNQNSDWATQRTTETKRRDTECHSKLPARATRNEKHTRMVWSTFANRGKSFTPESMIEILEERSALVERREETQEARGFAIVCDIVAIYC